MVTTMRAGLLATAMMLGALAAPALAQEGREILHKPTCESWQAGVWADTEDWNDERSVVLVSSEWDNDQGQMTCTVVEFYADEGGIEGLLTTTMSGPRQGAVFVADAHVEHEWECWAGDPSDTLDPTFCIETFGVGG